MAKKSNVTPGEINTWLSRIKQAEAQRDDADEKYGYSRAIAQYQGDFMSSMPSFLVDTDIVPINEVYAYAKVFIPTVYSRDPYIAVNPKGARSIGRAKINELFINAYWRELRLKREVKRCILDAILAEGWMKTGFSSVFGSIEPEEGEPGLEPSEFIKNEDIFATRVSWRNMVKDPDAVDGLHDARWVGQQIIKPLEAVKSSSIYENTADIAPVFIVRNEGRRKRPTNSRQEDQIEYACLWEIWDRDTQKVFTISEGATKYLMNKKWPYDMEGFPYALLRFNDNPDEPFAPNLIQPWEAQLWEKIKIRSLQLDHIKRFNRQLTVEEGSMSRSEEEKFRLGKTGSVIKRKKGTAPPEPIPYPQIQTDIYAIEGRIDLDKDNISGQPNAVRSAPQKTQSRTLGEIDRLIASFQNRQGEPQDIVEDFCEEIAYKLLAIASDYLPGEKFVSATQKDMQEIGEAMIDPVTGESRFDGNGLRFTKKDIQGAEFEIDVKAGSTLPLNRENRIETMASVLKLGPTLGIQPNGLVARTLGKLLLSDFEMQEVEAAYDEEQRQIDGMKQQAIAAKEAELRLQQDKLNTTRASGQLDQLSGLNNGVQ